MFENLLSSHGILVFALVSFSLNVFLLVKVYQKSQFDKPAWDPVALEIKEKSVLQHIAELQENLKNQRKRAEEREKELLQEIQKLKTNYMNGSKSI